MVAFEWTLSRAQVFINALLVHADTTLLIPIQHARFRFIIEPLNIVVDMSCNAHNAIVLSTQTPRPVSLTLRGKPSQYIKALNSHEIGDLHIEGDVKMAQALQNILKDLNIDVEAFLETIFGGTVAHALFSGFQKVRQKAKEVVSHTKQDIADYQQYEVNRGDFDA